MSLTMDFSTTLEAFASPLSIYVEDVEGHYVDGIWQAGEPVRREKPIASIMLALSVQTLFFYKEGSVSDGGIALLTQEELFFTNINNEGEINKQSYVIYQNMRFRVVGDGFISGWSILVGNANFKCYHALRDIR